MGTVKSTRIHRLAGLAGALTLVASSASAQYDWLPYQEAEEVAAGDYHSCMVTNCGDVKCWGRNHHGQANDRTDRVYEDVSVGQYHTCALDSQGIIRCWGLYTHGRLSVPLGTYRALDAGATHTCALRTDKTVACWGADDYGQVSQAPSGAFKDITAGGYHSCALRDDETAVVCWGRNSQGQLGSSDPQVRSNVILSSILPNGENFEQISAGGYHSCATSNREYVHCWGYNAYEAVNPPHPQLSNATIAAEIGNTGVFRWPDRKHHEVSAGRWGTCTVKEEYRDDFETQCWGWPFPLNGPLTSPNYTPPGDQTESVSVGSSHACLVSLDGAEAQAECFGSNAYGKATPPVLSGRCPLRFRRYEPTIPFGGFSLGG